MSSRGPYPLWPKKVFPSSLLFQRLPIIETVVESLLVMLKVVGVEEDQEAEKIRSACYPARQASNLFILLQACRKAQRGPTRCGSQGSHQEEDSRRIKDAKYDEDSQVSIHS